MKKFSVKISNGSIALPEDVLKEGSFQEGSVLNLVLTAGGEMKLVTPFAGRHRVFQDETTYDRAAIEQQLKSAGLTQSSDDPDVWVQTVKLAGGPAQKGVSKRVKKVNINDLIGDPASLRAFLRKH